MNIPHKNWIEWAVFGAGLLLLLAVAGYLVYEMATGSTTPAQLTVALGEPERTGNHYMVPVTGGGIRRRQRTTALDAPARLRSARQQQQRLGCVPHTAGGRSASGARSGVRRTMTRSCEREGS
jgi:hypothetical protein